MRVKKEYILLIGIILVLLCSCGIDEVNTVETEEPVIMPCYSYCSNSLNLEQCTLKAMINADGSIVENNYSMVTDYIPISSNTIVANFFCYAENETEISYGNIYSYALYDKEKALLDVKYFVSQSTNKVHFLPINIVEGTEYIRLTIDNRYYDSHLYQLVFDYDGNHPANYSEYQEPVLVYKLVQEENGSNITSHSSEIADIQGDVAQGCTYIGENKFVVALPNLKKFAIFNAKTENVDFIDWEEDYGHTNDMCYNPNTNKLYAVASANGAVNVFDVGRNLAFTETIIIDNDESIGGYVAGIAYDREKDRYYVYYYATGVLSNIYVYDGSFERINVFEHSAFETMYATQGMETDGKYIYRVQHINEKIGLIYIYDVNDGELVHINTYFDQGFEIQDFIYDWDGKYYISTGDYSYHAYIKRLDTNDT